MKLHQLRYVCEVVRRNLNVSDAAQALHTSQPGVSKQIQLLEEELGLPIFQRTGKRLTGISAPGEQIVQHAERVLAEVDNIRKVGEEYSGGETGTLSLATTHTQGRYSLPPVIQRFRERYPGVKLRIRQGNPGQITRMALSGEADIAIATEAVAGAEGLIAFPCFHWNRALVVPLGHPLLELAGPVSLQDIIQYPIVTYDFAFAGRSITQRTFQQAGLEPNIVLTAIDSDIIKTYVEMGIGIGLLAKMAYDPKRDAGLAMIDVSHLFEHSTTWLGIPKGAFLRGYQYDFISLLAHHLDRYTIEQVMAQGGVRDLAQMMDQLESY